MPSLAEVVAEITFQVNKAQAAKQVEEAVAGAKPVVKPGIDTAGTATKIDEAVAEAKPIVKPGLDTAGTAERIDEAVEAAHPVVKPGLDTAGTAEKIDEAVAGAHPVVEANVDEPRITTEVDQAVAGAHPTVTPAVNEGAVTGGVDEAVEKARPMAQVAVDEPRTGRAVEEAVEKSPPGVVPINTAGTGQEVEKGLKSADTRAAGEEGGEKFKSGFTAPVSALKGMVMGAIGAEAIMGGQQLFTTLIKASGDASKSTKVVTEAIKTTGGAAGVTADDIDKMAGAQARQTGVTKPAIEQADALILRFTNIKNAGTGTNAIFDRTSQAALDMTAALNKGVVTQEGLANTSKLLGKALDEPDKAAGALRRAGVDLDKAQQDQIKTFLKNNDTLDAQKVVLDAVNKSYGGTAAATASGTAKMKAALEELEASLGKTLLPIFASLIKAVTELLDVLAPVAEWFDKGGTTATILKDALFALVGGITLYIATVKTVEMVTKAWEAAQALLNLELAANPIGLVVVAVAALTIGIVELYKHSALFRDLVKETGEVIRTAFIVYLRVLREEFDLVRKALTDLVEFWRAGFDVIVSVTRTGVNTIEAIFRAFAAVLTALWRAEFDLLVAVARTALGAIAAAIRVFIDLITGIFRVGMDLIHGNWRKAWDDMGTTARQIGGAIGGYIRDLGPLWSGAIGQAGNAMSGLWHRAWDDMAATTRAGGAAAAAAIHGLEDVVRGIPGVFESAGRGVSAAIGVMRSAITALPHAIAAAVDGVVAAMTRMKQAVGDAADFVTSKLGAVGKAGGALSGLVGHIPGLSMGGDVGDMVAAAAAAYAGGGIIHFGSGPTADDVLIRASRGETVVSAADSRHPIMRAAFQAVGVPGYGAGGILGMIPGYAGGGAIDQGVEAVRSVMEWTKHQVNDAASQVLKLTSQALGLASKGLAAADASHSQVSAGFNHLTDVLSITAKTTSDTLSRYGAALSYARGGIVGEPPGYAGGGSISDIGSAFGSFSQWSTAAVEKGSADLHAAVTATINQALASLKQADSVLNSVEVAQLYPGGKTSGGYRVTAVGDLAGILRVGTEAAIGEIQSSRGGYAGGGIIDIGTAFGGLSGLNIAALQQGADLTKAAVTGALNAAQTALQHASGTLNAIEVAHLYPGGNKGGGYKVTAAGDLAGILRVGADAAYDEIKSSRGAYAAGGRVTGGVPLARLTARAGLPARLGRFASGGSITLPPLGAGSLDASRFASQLPALSSLISGPGGGMGGQGLDLAAVKAITDSNAQLSAQLGQIGALLQSNPQAVAQAVAQALNGVARLATAGAAYATR
jgi:Prophage tail length tape measure protein